MVNITLTNIYLYIYIDYIIAISFILEDDLNNIDKYF